MKAKAKAVLLLPTVTFVLEAKELISDLAIVEVGQFFVDLTS